MWKKGILAGCANFIVGMGLNFGLSMLLPSVGREYQNTAIFRPWSDPLMMLFFVHPFLLGVVLAYFWNIVSGKLNGKPTDKALQFAKIYFVIATVPGMFISLSSFQVSFLMIASWTIVGWTQAYISGLVFAKAK